jgi:hypothetical protein
MKKYYLFLAAGLLLAGCKNTQKQKENELNEAIENAQKSPIVETKLFLNFRFGMTDSEVVMYLDSLTQIGKLYTNSERKYQYDFTSEYGSKYYITFLPLYYDNKLYKMKYFIESQLGDIGYLMLNLAFMDKSEGFKRFTTNDIFDDEVYIHIKSNLIVTFEKNSRNVMVYENAPISKLVEDEERQKENEEYKKSASEF